MTDPDPKQQIVTAWRRMLDAWRAAAVGVRKAVVETRAFAGSMIALGGTLFGVALEARFDVTAALAEILDLLAGTGTMPQ